MTAEKMTAGEIAIPRRAGFTLIEAVVAVGVVAIGGGVAVVAMDGGRDADRRQQDAMQVRGLHQSMILWAQQNRQLYPLPSEIDRTGDTVDVGQGAGTPEARLGAQALDSTRHIFSLLIANGFIQSEICVSPVETGDVEVYRGYQVDEPRAAEDPERASWDPAFRATPADTAIGSNEEGDPGGFSYAHVPTFGERRDEVWRDAWRDERDADSVVIGNRGPQYDAQGLGGDITWNLVEDGEIGEDYDRRVGTNSNRLRFHGDPERWSGHVAYHDSRVEFGAREAYERVPDPEDLLFIFAGLDAGEREQRDNIFVNEDDEHRDPRVSWEAEVVRDGKSERNAYLVSYRDPVRIEGPVGSASVTIDPFYD